MSVHLRFLGASETVTGSCFVLEAPSGRLMVDCGMFQGDRRWQGRNREFKGVEPESIDAVILTHAHADHVGRLPRLVKQGFEGPVYATAATRARARGGLLD
jgi:metallo-beta-lactamase family protein